MEIHPSLLVILLGKSSAWLGELKGLFGARELIQISDFTENYLPMGRYVLSRGIRNPEYRPAEHDQETARLQIQILERLADHHPTSLNTLSMACKGVITALQSLPAGDRLEVRTSPNG
jgi:hypothetical protein